MLIRIVLYSLIVFFSFVLPWIPLPFQKPEVLHSLFASQDSTLVRFAIGACFIVTSIIIIICVLIIRVRKKVWRLKLLAESCILLVLPIARLFAQFAVNNVFQPFDTIVRLNQNREASAFVNPYLGYKKFDCTFAGSNYDQVFIPAHLGVFPTEFIVFAPRREDKSVSYRFGKKDGDWYLEYKDSIWNPELYNCFVSA